MGRLHNFVFNSAVGRDDPVNLSQNFYVKWGVNMPEDKAYLLTYSFMGAEQDISLFNNTVPNLFINLGDTKVSFAGGEFSGNIARPHTIVGLLQWQNSISGRVYASVDDNPPVYLPRRPTNENIQIFIRQNINDYEGDDTIYLNIGQWTLILSFEEIDEE
jgi:hypothetical protein